MALPNLLIVGAEKCGTTTLHAHLSKHPRAFMSNPKEPSFFLAGDPRYVNQEMHGLPHNYVGERAQYERLFAGAEGHAVRGEASPCYLYSDVAAQAIKDLIPDARIVISLRNPADRIWSQYLYNQQKGWERLDTSFEDALAREDERVLRNDMWAFHYRSRSRYYEQVRRYLEIFGEDRVEVVLFEDLKKDPTRLVTGLQEFLGLENVPVADAQRKHNPTSLPKSVLLHRITRTPNPLKSVVKAVMPHGLRRGVMQRLQTWNAKRPAADPARLKALLSEFEEDVEKLAGIIRPNPRVWFDKVRTE